MDLRAQYDDVIKVPVAFIAHVRDDGGLRHAKTTQCDTQHDADGNARRVGQRTPPMEPDCRSPHAEGERKSHPEQPE